MPVTQTVIQRYFNRLKKRRRVRGWVVDGDVLFMKSKHFTPPDKVFRIPVEFFCYKVQQVRDEFNTDPDMWDETHKERLKEVCGPGWSHISNTDRHKAAIMVRKRGILKRMKGGYRKTITVANRKGGESANGQ